MDQNQLQAQVNQVTAALNDLTVQRQQLRMKERNLAARETVLSNQYQVNGPANLRESLAAFLPPHLMPQNVGDVSEVAWPFWFPVDINFGTNPTLSNTSAASGSFQVTQEAAFLMTAISVATDDTTLASSLGPYQVTIRDNQSSRQLNDKAIPIQTLGSNSQPTMIPTPMLFQPNASVTLNMTTWLPSTVTMSTTGSGHFQIALFGLRVRVDDARKVLSSLFAPRN